MERDESTQTSVVLADVETPMRTGLRTALRAAGFTILAEAGDATRAVQAALAHRPRVCVLAVALPGDGIAAAEQIHQLVPENPPADPDRRPSRPGDVDALRAGADGYVPKTTSADRLPEAVSARGRGGAAPNASPPA